MHYCTPSRRAAIGTRIRHCTPSSMEALQLLRGVLSPSLAACSGAGGFTLGDYCKEKGQEWVRTFGTPHATHHPPPTTHHPPTTTTHPARVVVCIKHDLDQASTALQDDSHQGEVVVVVRWW